MTGLVMTDDFDTYDLADDRFDEADCDGDRDLYCAGGHSWLPADEDDLTCSSCGRAGHSTEHEAQAADGWQECPGCGELVDPAVQCECGRWAKGALHSNGRMP